LVGAPVNSLIVMYMVSPLRFRFSPTSTLADSVKTLFLRTSGLLLSGIVTVPPSPSPSRPLIVPSSVWFDPSKSLEYNLKEEKTPNPSVVGTFTVTVPLMLRAGGEIVDECGHFLPEKQPEWTTAVLLEQLRGGGLITALYRFS
jgi:hypothetical protein